MVSPAHRRAPSIAGCRSRRSTTRATLRPARPRRAVLGHRQSNEPLVASAGHGGVLFYAEALLAYWEALGIPVINPLRAYRFEKSKALQIGLFERLGVSYPGRSS